MRPPRSGTAQASADIPKAVWFPRFEAAVAGSRRPGSDRLSATRLLHDPIRFDRQEISNAQQERQQAFERLRGQWANRRHVRTPSELDRLRPKPGLPETRLNERQCQQRVRELALLRNAISRATLPAEAPICRSETAETDDGECAGEVQEYLK